MESFLGSVVIQAASVPDNSWGMACSYWNWAFWIGFVAGIIGAIVSYFVRPPKGM